ncbi:MAG: hypothetical protein WBO55_13385 [Rhizobiaceae bacterium]
MKAFLITALLLTTAIVGLTACQTGKPADPLSISSSTDPVEQMVFIAKAAQKCWFQSKDRAFTGYRMANEVNSPAGRPRILLVPKRDPGALPLLVVQAETKGDAASGRFTNIQTFGPILSTSNGERIANDVRRWGNGDAACT